MDDFLKLLILLDEQSILIGITYSQLQYFETGCTPLLLFKLIRIWFLLFVPFSLHVLPTICFLLQAFVESFVYLTIQEVV